MAELGQINASSLNEIRSAKLLCPGTKAAYDPVQWDMAHSAGDHAGFMALAETPDWGAVDRIAQARDVIPPSTLWRLVEQHAPGLKSIFSPFDPVPSTASMLYEAYPSAKVLAWTPYAHKGSAPRAARQKESHPNRGFGADGRNEVVYFSLNGELRRLVEDAELLIERCKRSLTPDGVLIVFVSKRSATRMSRLVGALRVQAMEIVRAVHGETIVIRPHPVRRQRSDSVAVAIQKYLAPDPARRVPRLLIALEDCGVRELPHRAKRYVQSILNARHWAVRKRAVRRLAAQLSPCLSPTIRERYVAFLRGSLAIEPPQQREIPKSSLAHVAEQVEEFFAAFEEVRSVRSGPAEQRSVSVFRTLDRIVLGVINERLSVLVEPQLSRVAIGGRPGNRLGVTIHSLRKTISSSPAPYSIAADIKGCFDEILHDQLRHVLGRRLPRRWSRALMALMSRLNPDGRGVGQGNPIAMSLVNLFLHHVADRHFLDRPVEVRRYVDDFAIVGDKKADVAAAGMELKSRLEDRGMRLHDGKSNLIPNPDSLNFLGLVFSKRGVRPEDCVIDAIRSLIEYSHNHLAKGRAIYLRRVLTHDEFRRSMGRLMPAWPWLRLVHDSYVDGSPSLSQSSKSSRARLGRRAAFGTARSHRVGHGEPQDGWHDDAILTPIVELDAHHPIRQGQWITFVSMSDYCSRFVVREILRGRASVLWIDRWASLANHVWEDAIRADQGGSLEIDRHGAVDLEIVGPENYGYLILDALSPCSLGTRRETLLRDSSDEATVPDAVPGLRCTWTSADAGADAGDKWLRDVIAPISAGEYRFVVVRYDVLHGNAAGRSPYAVSNQGLMDISDASQRCLRSHGFRPTVFVLAAPSGWTCGDGLDGIRPAGGRYLADRSDLIVGIDHSVTTDPPRHSARVRRDGRLAFPSIVEFRRVIYNLSFDVRSKNRRRARCHASFVAHTDDDVERKGTFRRGAWDEAGRSMQGNGFLADPPRDLESLTPSERRAAFSIDETRIEARLALRSWAAEGNSTPGFKSVRLAGTAASDPTEGRSIEARALEQLVARTDLISVPGSGCGSRGGDLRNDHVVLEVKATEKKARRLSALELRRIEAVARQEGRVPVHVTSFPSSGNHACYAAQSGGCLKQVTPGRSALIERDGPWPQSIGFESGRVWTLVSVEELSRLRRPTLRAMVADE